MRFRVDISLEIEADDYIAAAEHQRRISGLFSAMKQDYPDADLSFRQMRNVTSLPASPAPRSSPRSRGHFRHVTGNLSVYQER
jgi:hypothetical protein